MPSPTELDVKKMNLLLDTHTLIWVLENKLTLSKKALDAIIDGTNMVFVSATAWEISIKKAMGSWLRVPDNLKEEVRSHRFTALTYRF